MLTTHLLIKNYTMGAPKIAIVGRPNVGKSSLFNWLAGRRIAIVDPTAGVTRDRVSHLTPIKDRYVELIDTGGMGVKDEDNLTDDIEKQISIAIESANIVLFVVDVKDGITPLDELVSRKLRPLDVPVLTVVNKIDHSHLLAGADEFYKFGRKIIPVSVMHNHGKDGLIAAIYEKLPPSDMKEGPVQDDAMKIAIVGRRNVGKSTFINTLAQEPRMIVSSVPGTTRDSVDVTFELDGKTFIAIDTPGFRRKKSVTTNIDFYGTHRAERSIRRADVVLLFFDCMQRISKVEKQLTDYIVRECKPCIFVVNKWDLVPPGVPFERWVRYLRSTFRTMPYVPIAFITGQTGKNIKPLLQHAKMLFKQSQQRISTSTLNKLVRAAIEHNPPPVRQNRRPKIYYATQVAVQPPTIALFCNNPALIEEPYRRYLLSILRDYLPFGETPIKVHFRKREDFDRTNEIDKEIAPTEQTADASKSFHQRMLEEFPVEQPEDEEFAFLSSDEAESESTQRNSDTIVFGGLKSDPDNCADYIEEDAISDDGTTVDEITPDEQLEGFDKI